MRSSAAYETWQRRWNAPWAKRKGTKQKKVGAKEREAAQIKKEAVKKQQERGRMLDERVQVKRL